MQFVRGRPAAVGVQADQLRARVAVDHAIDVDHRDYLEDEIVEQSHRLLGGCHQELDNPL